MRTRTFLPLVAAVASLTLLWNGSVKAMTEADAQKILSLNPDPQLLAKLQKEFPVFKKLVNKGASFVREGSAPPAANAKPTTPPASSSKLPFDVWVRNDWSDLGLLGSCIGAGVDVSKAKGASVSFTQDYAASNQIVAAQGMIAAVYSDCNTALRPIPGGGDKGFFEKSIAIYAQINSTHNSSSTLASKNSDVRTFGLSSEVAYLHSGDYEVLRLTPNVVWDADKDTTAVAVMGQYIPLWVSHPGIWGPNAFPLFGGEVSYQFDPAIDFQFASTTDQKKPIQFSGKDQSFRIGPELTLIVQPFADVKYLDGFVIQETLHPWYEVYSSTGSYWWANSMIYNFTDNFAIGLSYNRGLDENSGAMTNQYVLSLNGKL